MTLRRAMVALAALLTLATSVAHADEIRIATQPTPNYAPIFIAKHKAWVEEELTKAGASPSVPSPSVHWASFAAGPPVNEAFAAGQTDFGFLGDTPALIGKAAGIDTRIVAKSSTGPKTLAVVVSANSPLTSPKDLKGKKVAVTKGSYAHHLLALVLQQGGLTLGDVELVNLPNGDIPNALISGDIDAGAVWEPVISKFERQKAIRVLADGSGIKSGIVLIIAANDFIKAKPEQVKAVLRAYARGGEFIKAHPQEAAEMIASDVNLSPDLLAPLFAKYDYNPLLGDDDVAEIKKSAEFMRANGLIRNSVDIDAFVDRATNRAVEPK